MGRDCEREKRAKKHWDETNIKTKEWGKTVRNRRAAKKNWGEAKSKSKEWGETNEEKSGKENWGETKEVKRKRRECVVGMRAMHLGRDKTFSKGMGREYRE